jgi:hypothetical protein
VDWIHLAQGRYKWWAFVNTEMNLRVCSREFVGMLRNKILDDERNRSVCSRQQPDRRPKPVCSSHVEQARVPPSE